MKHLMILAVMMLVPACSAQSNLTETPIVEEAIEEALVEPSATPDCLHADGVVLDLRRISDTTLELHVSGLQAGEKPSVIYSTYDKKGSSMGEIFDFTEGADEKGGFMTDIPGLIPLEGNTSATWDIRFIHSRGVECVTVTLP